jgi:hypothetical protein
MSSFAIKALAPALALATLVGACSDIYYDRRDTIALSAGDALASDKAIQTVDPWPPESNDRNIRFNGDKMQVAAARYRTGKVLAPRSIVTTPDSAAAKEPQPDAPPAQ